MIIDHRKVTLKETKHYNNVRNYLLGKDDTKKGDKELDRQKLLELIFPDDINNSGLVDSDNDRINNWLKSSNNSITAEDYILLSKYFNYDVLILFKNIDEICEFENLVLKACFKKLIDFTKKKFDDNKFFPTELKKLAAKNSNDFYFQVVESAINFTRLISSKLIMLEQEIDRQGLDVELLQKYLTISLSLINKRIFPNYQVFGDFSFEDARNGKVDDKQIGAALIGLDSFAQTVAKVLIKAKNGESAKFIIDEETDEGFEYKDCDPNKFDVERAKEEEDSGVYLMSLGRFVKYGNLATYSAKWNKSVEIIAVNNWIDLFKSLKNQLLLHSSEYAVKSRDQQKADNKKGYFIDEECSLLLDCISDYRFYNTSVIKDDRLLESRLKKIDNIGEYVLPILLKEYRELLNSSANPAFFINQLI